MENGLEILLYFLFGLYTGFIFDSKVIESIITDNSAKSEIISVLNKNQDNEKLVENIRIFSELKVEDGYDEYKDVLYTISKL
ncbi:hypothetical protein [Microcystis phage Mel-JY01]